MKKVTVFLNLTQFRSIAIYTFSFGLILYSCSSDIEENSISGSDNKKNETVNNKIEANYSTETDNETDATINVESEPSKSLTEASTVINTNTVNNSDPLIESATDNQTNNTAVETVEVTSQEQINTVNNTTSSTSSNPSTSTQATEEMTNVDDTYTQPNSNSWIAPRSADKLVNPMKGNSSASTAGKKLFKQMCSICHGYTGKGNGVGGTSLTPRPTNFTTNTFQKQSDGAIFWKMSEGKSPMAAYKDILSEKQRWQIVNFLRSLDN
tara:strand:+ start:35983 stop:36783 length:801 start_codon:yes stop_codon:yes gene_type:complete